MVVAYLCVPEVRELVVLEVAIFVGVVCVDERGDFVVCEAHEATEYPLGVIQVYIARSALVELFEGLVHGFFPEIFVK